MDPFAAAGLSQGVAQGLDKIGEGIRHSNNIKNQRDMMRQQANYQNQRLGMMQQQANSQQSQADLQIQMLQNQLSKMETDKAKEDAFNAFDAYDQTGDSKYLNLAIQGNEKLKSKFGNIARIDSPSIYNDDELSNIGFDVEKYKQDPGRYAVVNTIDGKKQPIDMYGIYATSGYMKRMKKDRLEEMKTKMQQAQTQKAENEASMSTIKLDDMKNYLDQNPDATLSDYLATTKAPSMSDIKAGMEIQQQQIDNSIEELVTNDPDKFVENLKTMDKNDKLNINGKDVSLYKIAKDYQGKGKLDNNYMNELRGKRSVIQGSRRIKDKMDKMDWNALSKASSKVEGVIGDFVKNLGTDRTTNKNAEKEALKRLEESRAYLDAYTFTVLADYIKAMSGAAVSEQERTAYVNNMTAGWMADKTAFRKAITGFSDGVADSFNTLMDSIATSYPKTYLDLKLDNDTKESTKSETSEPNVGTLKDGQIFTGKGGWMSLGSRISNGNQTMILTEKGWVNEG